MCLICISGPWVSVLHLLYLWAILHSDLQKLQPGDVDPPAPGAVRLQLYAARYPGSCPGLLRHPSLLDERLRRDDAFCRQTVLQSECFRVVFVSSSDEPLSNERLSNGFTIPVLTQDSQDFFKSSFSLLKRSKSSHQRGSEIVLILFQSVVFVFVMHRICTPLELKHMWGFGSRTRGTPSPQKKGNVVPICKLF